MIFIFIYNIYIYKSLLLWKLLFKEHFPEFIKLVDNKITDINPGDEKHETTFKYFDSGGSGKIYLNQKETLIIKLLHTGEPDDNAFKERCTNEIEKQIIAANTNLAPDIINYGFQPLGDKTSLCFMKMKYLSHHIDLHKDDVLEKYNDAICDFIHKLSNINLINIIDAKRHFYLDNGNS